MRVNEVLIYILPIYSTAENVFVKHNLDLPDWIEFDFPAY